MKHFTKFMLLSAGVVVASSAIVGCGGNPEDPNSLIIHAASLGYGVNWMEDLAKAYTQKTNNKVSFKAYPGQAGVNSLYGEITSGETKTDLFFTKVTDFFLHSYNGLFADITDVLTEKDAVTGKSIEDRIDQDFIDYYKVNNKYYGIGWANGLFGIVRNKDVWSKLELTDADIPYTTDEMFALGDKIIAKDVKVGKTNYKLTPFVYSSQAEYYTSLMPVWFAQYEGSESLKYFDQCLDPAFPSRPLGPSQACASFFDKQGIYESINIIEKLLDPNKKYQFELSTSYDFKMAQNEFLRGNNALFMANGSWLETETSVTDYNADFIPTPIISSIIDRCDTIKDDATLSAVVKALRNETKIPEGVSEGDIEIISDAVYNSSYLRSGCDHHLVIPSVSSKKDIAKDFIKFMYSDEGLAIYHKSTKGGMLGATPSSGSYDDTGIVISDFKKSFNKLLVEDHIRSYEAQAQNKIYSKGGVHRMFGNGLAAYGNNVVSAITKGQMSAQEISDANINYVKNNWTNIYNNSL